MRRLALLSLLLLAGCAAPLQGPVTADLPPYVFTTDGCSDPFGIHRKPEYTPCCIVHDALYWRGGSADDRLRADRTFRACIRTLGFPDDAERMYIAVRGFGGPEVNTPWRWGYGWPYPRGYR